MSEERDKVAAALASYNPDQDAHDVELGEQEREKIRELFPLEAWAELELIDYAAGQENSENTYCRWVEFRSPHLGSIRGGSAVKLIVYKHKDGDDWYFDKAAFDSVEEAWQTVRAEFVSAFDSAKSGDWSDIDDLATLRAGQALLVKSLHVYFYDEILPIASREHLHHFLGLLDDPSAGDKSLTAVKLNRALLAVLRQLDGGGLSTLQLERFLYRHFPPPSTSKWWKIAPGEKAVYWEQFRKGSFAAVGWEPIGDLREFADKEEFTEHFKQVYAKDYGGHAHVISRKANELWRMIELRPGDRIVANRGTSKVLAVGTVTEPAYAYDPSNEPFHHLVSVKWDESYAKEIPQQGGWLNTIDKVKPETIKLIEGQAQPASATSEVDPLYTKIADALESKGQVVLYGPPGTGKTFHARRFAAWWLRKKAGIENAQSVLADSDSLEAAEREFSETGSASNAWVMVASPKYDWSWEDLFDQGSADFEHKRLRSNFAKVQKGDLVFGYASTPTKRLVALARISRELGLLPDNEHQTIGIEPLKRIENGPEYKELSVDPMLAKAEPLVHRFQGTLFALTAAETDHLIALIEECDANAVEDVDTVGSSGRWNFTTFHPSYGYEDFVEGFRPVSGPGGELALELEDGVFKRLCLAARSDPGNPYLLIVDEINRANLAKVFGELITLLETDKRGLQLTLPQSKERFEVPPNVFMIGTMNTADRSIALMDVALRRRFAFIELMPEPDSVDQAVGPLKLADFLAGLNRAVARVAGRENQVGHAYLMPNGSPISDATEFAQVFRLEILPLLQEYCFEEYDQLADILGPGIVDAEAQTLKQDVLEAPDELLQILATRFSASAAEK